MRVALNARLANASLVTFERRSSQRRRGGRRVWSLGVVIFAIEAINSLATVLTTRAKLDITAYLASVH